MSYKTIPDVADGLRDIEPQHAENTHFLVQNSESRIYATIPGQTFIRPVLQVHIIHCLGIKGIEIQISFTTTQERTYCVVI